MEKVYVSLGNDCGGAGSLRKAGKKTYSFPFDWLVCFHSPSAAFQNDFKGFLEDRVENTELRGVNVFNLDYNIRFFHPDIVSDEMLQRRVDRLLKFLRDSDKEMIFLRRSHDPKQHQEMVMCGLEPKPHIDEVEDMKKLRDILLSKYPNLKFKLNLFLQCPHCNKDQGNYTDEYLNIRRSTQMHIPNQNEEPWCKEFDDWVKSI